MHSFSSQSKNIQSSFVWVWPNSTFAKSGCKVENWDLTQHIFLDLISSNVGLLTYTPQLKTVHEEFYPSDPIVDGLMEVELGYDTIL
jgi:hypothetical protein